MRTLLIIIFTIALAYQGFAQSGKRKEAKRSSQPTSVDPGLPPADGTYAPKRSKAKSKGVTHNAERDYYERMEALAKEKRKTEKEMQKPQYSDPMYFGHKRPPKKRPPEKMKFCKVCGIRH